MEAFPTKGWFLIPPTARALRGFGTHWSRFWYKYRNTLHRVLRVSQYWRPKYCEYYEYEHYWRPKYCEYWSMSSAESRVQTVPAVQNIRNTCSNQSIQSNDARNTASTRSVYSRDAATTPRTQVDPPEGKATPTPTPTRETICESFLHNKVEEIVV